jgi:UDP-hydrolysing UDP-N-acetyl-D-glucosamine 2-epimerase
MRTIAVFTGARAEFGLLRPLLEAVRDDPGLRLRLLVSGMHLSPEFGLTRAEIEASGFTLDEAVEMLVSSDTRIGQTKSMGLALIGYGEALARLAPDILVVLGDRFEAFCAATAATILGLPLAHVHGGEATQGAVDECLRHAITKMSHLHFTSTEAYRRRVIQLGERPGRVFRVGALGIECIRRFALLSPAEAESRLGFPLGGRYLLATYHPVTLETEGASGLSALLAALEDFPDLRVVFTQANADAEGREVNRRLAEYAASRPDRVAVRASLGQTLYLSLMARAAAVVGNSSSGLLEAPALGVPSVDIGDRQKGRIRPASVLHCRPEAGKVCASLAKALDPAFRASLTDMDNPYEGRCPSADILGVLKTADLTDILKKDFYDLPFQPESFSGGD